MFKIEQNPFSLYDFLGYFTPGAAFLLAFELCPVASGATKRIALDDPKEAFIFVLSSYVCGHLLSFLSSLFVERYSVWRYGYPSKYLLRMPTDNFWFSCPGGCFDLRHNALRVLVTLSIAPVALLDLCVDKAFGRAHAKALDRQLATAVQRSLDRLLDKDTLATDSDFHRSAYHVAVELAPAHLPKMQNYVALYGFVRVTCFALLVITWVLLVVGYRGRVSFWWPAATAVGSFLFFLAFIKFYRRFSLEVLMAIHAQRLIKQWNDSGHWVVSDAPQHPQPASPGPSRNLSGADQLERG